MKSKEPQFDGLLKFGARSYSEELSGFGRLNEVGKLSPNKPLETWINARMTYCFAIESVKNKNYRKLAELGVKTLSTKLEDRISGGWFESTTNQVKSAYTHAFVLLAAATTGYFKIEGGAELFLRVEQIIEQYYWRDAEGACVEQFNRDWSDLENYRGANSNMHFVEAFLAAYDFTKNVKWLERARSISDKLINNSARNLDWKVPEHFKSDWQIDFEYNVDKPKDPFRPFGSIIGHWFEWARLNLHLASGLRVAGLNSPSWLFESAVCLYEQARGLGWCTDGSDGFIYTVDFQGKAVVDLRMHWVLAEAISAAEVLHIVSGQDKYKMDIEVFWKYAESSLIDPINFSWCHELDSKNQPSRSVWADRPDIYHAYHAFKLQGKVVTTTLFAN
jgi:mannose/cellobiose epimerase-like protein (N-acyl-D-glucosamine 2-epimerase family)